MQNTNQNALRVCSPRCAISAPHLPRDHHRTNGLFGTVIRRLQSWTVKQGGSFGYTAVLPESAAAQNPTVKITRVRAQPDPSKVREFADDVRDGKFVLPIGRRMPLRDAAEAHVLGEKGGIGKILLLAPHSKE